MSNSSAARSFKERMKDAKLPHRVVRINTATKLVERHAALNQQLADAMKADQVTRPRRLGQAAGASSEVEALTVQVEALEAEMEDSWVDFVLDGKPWNVWRDFKEANPPKIAGQLEQRFEIDSGAVVKEFLRGCITEPVVDDEDWANMLAGGIWPADLDMLAANVIGMHEVGFSVPKSRLVSAVRATFDEQSEQLADSASQFAASTGGSRRKGTTTSTRMGSQPATPS